jgi:thiol-disulfide isomerase/thioredoxin
MKIQIVIISIYYLLIVNIGPVRSEIITYPEIDKVNSSSFEITKIETDSSKLVLYCERYGKKDEKVILPSNCFLKGNSGKIYKIFKSDGLEFDSVYHLPLSGNLSFRLFADPLMSETSFDFIDSENDFLVEGVKMFKQPKEAIIRCKLSGVVFNRPYSSRLMLTKASENFPVAIHYIPIKDGKFDFEFTCNEIEAYSLVFYDEYLNNYIWNINFFAETGEVKFKLFPIDDRFNNQVVGGPVNNEYVLYQQLKDKELGFTKRRVQEDSLIRNGLYYTSKYIELTRQLEVEKEKTVLDSLKLLMSKLTETDLLTKEAIRLNQENSDMSLRSIDWQIQYTNEHCSLVSYYLLTSATSLSNLYMKDKTPLCLDIFKSIYENKYPTHPYTKMMRGLADVKVGNMFIDFVAPDFNGKLVRLSDEIKGKVALIDFWASWCGSCRNYSKKMIPIYEKFKDNGFIVIGIARENQLKTAVNTVRIDKYPWLNLVELNDQGNIWFKYGFGSVGGGSILVDKQGRILAVDPKVEDIDAILGKLL